MQSFTMIHRCTPYLFRNTEDLTTMLSILTATLEDIPALLALLNSAYRGEESRKGWTTEADLLDGNIRTDVETLERLLSEPEGVILKCTGNDQIVGCVHLKKNGERLYLGMLSVSPSEQGRGIGKMFLKRAEEHAREVGCTKIYMQVISIRTELNNWYVRHGYVATGERFPFDVDEKYGVQTQPLEFMILEKVIG